MKNVHDLLSEVKGEKAHKQAVAMGLKYKGFGYWVDPSTGEVAYKTENDSLVPVEPDVESEKAGPGNPEMEGGAPSGGMGNPEGMGGSFGTFMNKQLPTGMGTNVQDISDNGLAQAPNTDNGRWEPGPDGDTFAGDEDVSQTMNDWNKPKKDAYVGKTNSYGWTAGADGDNYTTMTLDKIMKKAYSLQVDDSISNPDREVPTPGMAMAEAVWDNLMEAAEQTSDSNPSLRAQILSRVRNNNAPPGMQMTKDFQRLKDADPEVKQKVMDSLGKTPVMSSPVYDGSLDPGDYTKAVAVQKKLRDLGARVHDGDLLKRMNDNAAGLVSNPDYDMKAKGDPIGEGAFGQVYMGADGKSVIKEGDIGPAELKALFAMRDNPAFPTLLNAKFNTPFLHQSALDRDDPRLSVDTQFNPDDYDDFNKRYPTAEGTYAMSLMGGDELAENGLRRLSPENKVKALMNLWRARAQLHQAGFAHNDMHGGNVFVDDDGNIGIMDLGMAQDDPLAGLLEALAGFSDKDTQLSKHALFENLDPEMRADLLNRKENVREMIMDNFSPDADADIDETPFQVMEEFMEGGIRQKGKDIDMIREMIPYLADNKNIKKLVKELYGKLLMTDTEGRMNDAFEKLQADSKTIKLANLMRARQGRNEIEVKNKNVVPPKNLIFDTDD